MRAYNIRHKFTGVYLENAQKKIPVSVNRLTLTTSRIMNTLKQDDKKISILITDDNGIKKINSKHLNKNRPTDVLAFPYDKNFLGDIAVSVETAKKNSRIFNTTTEYETLLYITHGILHILGYDDKTKKQRAILSKKQSQILKKCL